MSRTISEDPHGWRKEWRDLLRAIAGGSIVGMPLLYTMEMWEHGVTSSAWHLLTLLAAMLAVNLVFCYLSGFRKESSIAGAGRESITAVGIALCYSAAVLCLVGEVDFSKSAAGIPGKVLVEAAAVSIGISFASAQMQGKSRTGQGGGEDSSHDKSEQAMSPGDWQLRADLREFAAALVGSTVFALNIAPTEEITLISSRLAPLQLLAVLGFSLVLCYVILFASEFREHKVHVQSLAQHPFSETLLTCATSLVVAVGLLLLLGDRSIVNDPATFAASAVALGLPAIVGGAAGRLLV